VSTSIKIKYMYTLSSRNFSPRYIFNKNAQIRSKDMYKNDHGSVYIYLILIDVDTLFSKVIVPIYTPTKNIL